MLRLQSMTSSNSRITIFRRIQTPYDNYIVYIVGMLWFTLNINLLFLKIGHPVLPADPEPQSIPLNTGPTPWSTCHGTRKYGECHEDQTQHESLSKAGIVFL